MHLETGEIKLLHPGDVIPEGFKELPKSLQRHARIIGDGSFADLDNGGKLAKWASRKRKRRKKEARDKMVQSCIDYYRSLNGW